MKGDGIKYENLFSIKKCHDEEFDYPSESFDVFLDGLSASYDTDRQMWLLLWSKGGFLSTLLSLN